MSWEALQMGLEIGLIYGIVALGVYLSFRILDYADLTCDGSFVLGAVACSLWVRAGHNPWLGLCWAIGAGVLAGLLTGAIRAFFRLTDLLSGILVTFMLYSINLRALGGVPNLALLDVPNLFTGFAPLGILGFVALGAVVGLYGLLCTDWGLALRSVGQNKRLAQNLGVRLGWMTALGLGLSNGLIALGGALFSQHEGFVDVGSGLGTLVIALVSILLGERFLPARNPGVCLLGCLIGSVLYRIVIGLALEGSAWGLQTQDLNLLTGVLILITLALPRRRGYAPAR